MSKKLTVFTILNIGGTIQIDADLTPANASNKKLIWSSSDSEIASVDNTGTVTARQSGVVLITAVAETNSDISASCIVKIPQSVEEITPLTGIEFYDAEEEE